MSLLDTITGGASSDAQQKDQEAAEALQGLQAPTAQALDLPELEQYAAAQQMTPAQMQAFLQSSNALGDENTSQQGTAAQVAALNQLSQVANAGAAGTPEEQAQIAQALQTSNQNLAGQRGSIDQAAESRGVPLGLLQAALSQQNAGQDTQNANQAALSAQSNAYQQALQAMSQGATVGSNLQGQQNTQANTVAQAQNAMQQFNAANQQAASANNAQFQQGANSANTNANNAVSQANTGLANQRTQYNAGVPQTVYQDQLQQANGIAQQENNQANLSQLQGQQNAGAVAGLLGTAANLYAPGSGALVSGALTSNTGGSGGTAGYAPPASANTQQYAPLNQGGVIPMKAGGMVPGKAPMPGDHLANDIVPAKLSPGEAVIPRTAVQANPMEVLQLLAQKQPMDHHPADVATLLKAMKSMRMGGPQ